MGDHVGHGEVAGRVKLLLQFLIEAQIDVHLAIARRIERTGGRSGISRSGLHRAGVEDQFRILVAQPLLAEQIGPDVLGLRQHDRDELRQFILLGRRHVRR